MPNLQKRRMANPFLVSEEFFPLICRFILCLQKIPYCRLESWSFQMYQPHKEEANVVSKLCTSDSKHILILPLNLCALELLKFLNHLNDLFIERRTNVTGSHLFICFI